MNIIKTTPISVPHSLRIFTIDQVLSFTATGGKAFLNPASEAIVSEEDVIPGTLEVADQPDETGLYAKTYSFRIRGVNLNRTQRLKLLSSQWCIILYADESGNERVGGSRDWPLSFSFCIADGAYKCTLTGTGIEPDPFKQ